jgi:hypothetical protein
VSEKPEASPRQVYVSFADGHYPKHPTRRTAMGRLEITELPAAPNAADSSTARFLPGEAALSCDVTGVLLKLEGGEERRYPWASVSETCNVPAAKAGK